jgi:MoaA/NifB/PqqE/SkfB family radical SAM enzyme
MMTHRSDPAQGSVNDRAKLLLSPEPDWYERFISVKRFSGSVRASEYHLTNACNIRCKGCWFFEFGHDKSAKEEKSLTEWESFVLRERARGVNSALLIGGEPTMFPERIAAFARVMDTVSVSTNGLLALPMNNLFSKVTVFISLFGGGPLDDELRAIKPSGKAFSGLFDTALTHYANDPRVTFVYAVTEDGAPYIEDTVRRIRDNGNKLTFNFYSKYNTGHPLRLRNGRQLLASMTEMKARYPETVLNHPEHIRAIVTGEAWCGKFSGEVCPSVSFDHPENKERLGNGHPILPGFNAVKADLKTLERCCTSGHCDDCRDSQAVYSWLMVSLKSSLDSPSALKLWIECAESYWSQFIWSPYRGVNPAQQSLFVPYGAPALAEVEPPNMIA